MSELTKLYLPPSLPFPITITAVLFRPPFDIAKHTPLLKYKYWESQVVPKERLEPEEVEQYEHSPKIVKVESIGSFESPIAGKVSKVSVKVGDVFDNDKHVIGLIEEPCTHAVQFGGLCGICGANLVDEADYTSYNNKDRAPITMSHQSTQLTVSLREAERIEKGSRKKLLREKKLILVVDLDQTVIQTINDPTVYAWQQDPKNPNHEAVKDVRSFALEERFKPVGSNKNSPSAPPAVAKSWYYVKLRPGLKEFLEKIAPKYEMHIYTMATRDYAKEIAKIIDPDGKYFGDRILSRDESGSITQKSLHRLFPTNTSMVVIIDDRGDVWQWCPNLIKVVPYDFFIGIGDINSGFLPKQNNLLRPSKKRKIIDDIENQFAGNNPIHTGTDANMVINGDSIPSSTGNSDEATSSSSPKTSHDNYNDDSSSSSSSDSESESQDESARPASISSFDNSDGNGKQNENSDSNAEQSSSPEPDANSQEEAIREAQNSQRAEYLKRLADERPLAKLQETLEKKIQESGSSAETTASLQPELSGVDDKEEASAADKKTPSNNKTRANGKKSDLQDHSLLYDDDTELDALGTALLRVNERFYEEYVKDKAHPPDIKTIMPEMKSEVLGDVHILFSGVIPINGNPNAEHDIVTWSRNFGATIENRVSSKLTHIVSFEAKTIKIKFAKTLYQVEEKIKIVHPDWLFACFSNWQKVPTAEYEIKFDPKDKLSGKDMEILKETIYEPDEEENLEFIENIDLTGADQELEDFLESSDGNSSSDDDDDDDDDGDDNDDDNDDGVDNKRDGTGSSISNGNNDSGYQNGGAIGVHHVSPRVGSKRPRLSLDEDGDIKPKIPKPTQVTQITTQATTTGTGTGDDDDYDDFAEELEMELESDEEDG